MVARHARPETLRHYMAWDVELAAEVFGTIPDPLEEEG